MHSGNAGGNRQNITVGTNTTAAVTQPLIVTRGNTDCMRRHLHHFQMLHWFGVDVLVIIAGWYAGPALTLSAS
jgi:hypothetical protein